MSDIRYNLLEECYVIIAPERLHRPENMAWEREEKPEEGSCPFCEGNEVMTPPEIDAIRKEGSRPNEKGWQTRVVPNLYKAVAIEMDQGSQSDGIYKRYEGFGAHEIIIDTPEHFTGMREWEYETFLNWLLTLQRRVRDLKRDQRIVSVSLFKNEGSGAGATQAHSHTQLIGLPLVPTDLMAYYKRLQQHYHATGHSLIDDIIAQEQCDSVRIVMESDHFIAFCPYASGYPFEVMVVAKRGVGSIERMEYADIQNLSVLLKGLISRMDEVLGVFDFNLSLSVPPLQKISQTDSFFDDIEKSSRFTLQIRPRIYTHGGFEVFTAMMINPVPPEESAKLLREAADG